MASILFVGLPDKLYWDSRRVDKTDCDAQSGYKKKHQALDWCFNITKKK
jgi:hypothetical protein